MDQELKTYLDEREARMDERFARMEERFARMEDRMNERFEQVDTEVRHTRVLVEAVHGDVRLVAEGLMGVSESQEALRKETADKLEEIKTLVTQSYQNLNGRVQNLDNRVKLLEDKAERQTRDVLEVIREKFGKPQA